LRSRKIFYGLGGERILWRNGDAVTVLRRSDGGGQIVAVANSKVGSETFSGSCDSCTAIGQILDLCWFEIVAENATDAEIALYGLDNPQCELDVNGHTLLIGRAFGERVYCLDAEQGAIVALTTDSVLAIESAIVGLGTDSNAFL
jgi:hypothetical protein